MDKSSWNPRNHAAFAVFRVRKFNPLGTSTETVLGHANKKQGGSKTALLKGKHPLGST
jgi:hypothetical protein